MYEIFQEMFNGYKTLIKASSDYPLFNRFTKDLKNELLNIVNSKFSVKGSLGSGNKADCPFMRIYEKSLSKSSQKGIYIVYIFKHDMEGCYLCLAQGSTYITDLSKQTKNKELCEILNNSLKKYIKKLPIGFTKNKIELLSESSIPKSYEETVLCSKYYSKVELNSDIIITKDLNDMIKIYDDFMDELNKNGGYEKVINSLVGDISITNTLGANKTKNDCKWIDYIHNLVEVILNYKNNRNEFNTKFLDALKDDESNAFNIDLNNITPFDPIIFLTNSVNNKKISESLRCLENAFAIKSVESSEFNSFPPFELSKFLLNESTNEKENLINTLWDLMDLIYDCDESTLNDDDIKDYLTTLSDNNIINAEFSSLLYLINPSIFTPLTKTVIEYLNDTYNANLNEENIYDPSQMITSISDILKNIKTYIPRVENITELVSNAYNASKFDSDMLADIELELSQTGKNIIVYGTPGCGKSYYVEHDLITENFKSNIIRTTFYYDYSYSDFIGQLVPAVNEKDEVTYKYAPGIFVQALKLAINNPNKPYFLVIEEINRGNAPAIFGDVFQLLDRYTKDDKDLNDYKFAQSRYPIFNKMISDYLKDECAGAFSGEEIYIPSNLYIIGTMNTSDQNVFTLDTAFKRRWIMKKVPNDFSRQDIAKLYVPKTDITWKSFAKAVNARIQEAANIFSNEDKELGVHFISKDSLMEKSLDDTQLSKNKFEYKASERFAYKVFEYLWNDIQKVSGDLFRTETFNSLDAVINYYLSENNPDFEKLFNNIGFIHEGITE